MNITLHQAKLFAFVLISILVFSKNKCQSQYQIIKINETYGLMAPDYCMQIWQDTDGYMWVLDEFGFNRLNGTEVKNYPIKGKTKSVNTNIMFDGDDFYFGGGKFSNNKISYDSTYGTYAFSFPRVTNQLGGLIYKEDTFSLAKRSRYLSFGEMYADLGFHIEPEIGIDYFYNIKGEKLWVKDIQFYDQYSSYLKDYNYILRKNPSLVFPYHDLDQIMTRYGRSFDFILGKDNMTILRDSALLYIDKDLKQTLIRPKDFRYIEAIVQFNGESFFVVTLENNELLRISNNGDIISKFDVFEDSEHRDCKLTSFNEVPYLITKNSLYSLHTGKPNKLLDLKGFNVVNVFSDDHILLSHNDEGWLYEYKDSNLKKLLNIRNSDGKSKWLKQSFLDSESNLWLILDYELFKLSPIGTDNYYHNWPSDMSVNNSVYPINGVVVNLTTARTKLLSENGERFFTISNSTKRDSIYIGGVQQFLGYINDDKILLSEKVISDGAPQNTVSYLKTISYDSIINYKTIDSVTNGGYGSLVNGFISKYKDDNGQIFELKNDHLLVRYESASKLNIEYVNISRDVLIRESTLSDSNQYEHSYFVLKDGAKYESFSPKDIGASLPFTTSKKSYTITRDTLIIFDLTNGKLSRVKIKNDFVPRAYYKIIQLNHHLFTFISLQGELIFFDSNSETFSKPLINKPDEFPFIRELFYDENKKTLTIVTEEDIFQSQLINDKVDFVHIFTVPEDLGYYDIFYRNVDDNIFFRSQRRMVKHSNSFKLEWNELQFKIFDIISSDKTDKELQNWKVGETINLSHQHNNLTFSFAAITNYFPETVLYHYKLEGGGYIGWKSTKEKSINFSNLNPGDYKLIIYSENHLGIKSQQIEIAFKINHPWYLTWFAIAAYVLLTLIIFYLFVQYRARKFKKRQAELELEVQNATKEIISQKDKIEMAHLEIKDSINYAKRIQSAILPPKKLIKEHLENSFILYKPKDIVAGDFYWMEPQNGRVLFAAADCTGHGVPGAMVSVVCNNGLNRSVREYGLTDPGEILSKTREIVIAEFEKSEEEVKDGMDIALCSIEGNQLKYSGAHNPLWIIRNGANEVEEIKADKQPIGKYDKEVPYSTHSIELQKGDSIYIFSDGFADQFGGEGSRPGGKKYKAANFKRLLLSIQNESLEKQHELIDKAFEDWKGEIEQLDDVCVIGYKH